MKKKLVMTTLLAVALCAGLAACATGEPAAQNGDGDAAEAPAEQGLTAYGATEPAANMFGNEIPEFDQQCLSCHGSYEEVAARTADYGDSNPHDSVHGGYATCQNCHEADKVVNEDHDCKSCHDWPRAEDGHL